MLNSPAQSLERLFLSAVAAVSPSASLAGHWPAPPAGRLAVLAIGKCAAAMAGAATAHYGRRTAGLVLVPDGHLPDASPGRALVVMHSSHPVPDQRSVAAADAALALAASLGPDDLLLVLLSGGGSSVACKPRTGISLAEKQALSRQLHLSGASIAEINCVRRQLSAFKGGRLSAASRAPVVTLAISDVPGDDPALIASGPTVFRPESPRRALEILERYGIEPGSAVRALWQRPSRQPRKPRNSRAERFVVVASGQTMLQAAERELARHDYHVINLGDGIGGEARELAKAHARLALASARKGRKCAILSGGESTVTIRGDAGLGGRNTEYLLALAIELDSRPGTWAMAGDSDGLDGRGQHAGAIIGPDSLERARRLGFDARRYLEAHDSGSFFAATGDLVVTGPTLTNVSDFRAILLE